MRWKQNLPEPRIDAASSRINVELSLAIRAPNLITYGDSRRPLRVRPYSTWLLIALSETSRPSMVQRAFGSAEDLLDGLVDGVVE